MQSGPDLIISSNVVSLNPAHGEVYSIQHYVINLAVTCGRSLVFSGYSELKKKKKCKNIERKDN